MCVATIIEKTTNTTTSLLHQLSQHKVETIICVYSIEFYHGLESEIATKRNGTIYESNLRFQGWPKWNSHVSGTTFQGGLRFQTGLSLLRISSKLALS